jgi:hypothetical protein
VFLASTGWLVDQLPLEDSVLASVPSKVGKAALKQLAALDGEDHSQFADSNRLRVQEQKFHY